MKIQTNRSLVEDLEEQVEFWREKAERFERVLKGAGWDDPVPPLTLQQTRIMRIIAARPSLALTIADALQDDYPRIEPNTVKVQINKIRGRLPAHLAPRLCVPLTPYTVPDREALRAFIGGFDSVGTAA